MRRRFAATSICFAGSGFLSRRRSARGCKSWKVTGSWHQPPLGFSFDEAVALYLGRRFLEPLAGTLFWDASQRSSGRSGHRWGKPPWSTSSRLAGSSTTRRSGRATTRHKADLIDVLMVAIEDRKAVHIAYRSQHATEPATRDVYPYGLVYHRGSLYLVAQGRSTIRCGITSSTGSRRSR